MPAAIEKLREEPPTRRMFPNPDVTEQAYRGTMNNAAIYKHPLSAPLMPISLSTTFAAADMFEDERQKNEQPTLVPAFDASSPPTYESVVYAYGDDEPLWSERDNTHGEYTTANNTPQISSLDTASTSSQLHELHTISILPPGSDRSEEKVPIYHYTDPITGEVISSLLPWGHPEILCLQAGGHIKHTRFGPLGIAAAVLWFPFGVVAMWEGRTVSCSRCHRVLKGGRMWKGKDGGCGKRRATARARSATNEEKTEECGNPRKQKGGCWNRRHAWTMRQRV